MVGEVVLLLKSETTVIAVLPMAAIFGAAYPQFVVILDFLKTQQKEKFC